MTVIWMWNGCRQRPGLRQSCVFPRRSPSVDSSGKAWKSIAMTRSSRHTLSACRRQSIRRIFPFWSGVERTQQGRICPVTALSRYSRCSGRISLRNLARSCEAHFLLTSGSSLSSSLLHCRSSSSVIRLSCSL